MKTVELGKLGENEAARFLKSKKIKIVKQNVHASHNELDIVALDKKNGILIFVEVKTRTVDKELYSKFGTPASSVTKQKQKRTIAAAKAYILNNKNTENFQIRFDVIEVYVEKDTLKIIKLNHIENAFCA